MILFDINKKVGRLEINAAMECKTGESISIIGKSGAGKTSLLRILAGLEKPDSGRIINHGKVLFSHDEKINIPPHKRKISYVFQEYTLFPHWSIEKNIVYTAKNNDFAYFLIEHFKITHISKRKPYFASGGEKQRAALAQAIAREPDLLLLDEPFSSLDPENRKNACDFLTAIRNKITCPFILVTHDHKEAAYLGDSICVMENGGIKDRILSEKSYKNVVHISDFHKNINKTA